MRLNSNMPPGYIIICNGPHTSDQICLQHPRSGALGFYGLWDWPILALKFWIFHLKSFYLGFLDHEVCVVIAEIEKPALECLK